MSKDAVESFEFAQKQLSGEIDIAKRDLNRCRRDARGRRALLYIARGVPIVGGLVITVWSDAIPDLPRWVGPVITLTATVDTLFCNHTRLIAAVESTRAYERLLNEIVTAHNLGIREFKRLKPADPEAAREDLTDLLVKLQKKLSEGRQAIADARHQEDVKALISLEENQNGSSGGPSDPG